MNSRERFLAACECKPLDFPPVWLMRQAGRYLPEYRKLKEKHGFLHMVQTPELATQVTLQPVTRFAVDAAILFCDILVIPEAMGVAYSFRDVGGIQMEKTVCNKEDIARLSTCAIEEQLEYVAKAIELTKSELAGKTALIGFGGSPWTLATYMVEGGSSKNFALVKGLFYEEPALFHQLLEKLTEALIKYFKMQIRSGVDAIQIFDSWGGVLSHTTFWEASAKYMAEIVKELDNQVPIIVFSKGSHHWKEDLLKIKAPVLGIDSSISMAKFYDDCEGKIALQGNLEPVLMSTSPEAVTKETKRILEEMKNRPGHIFNLGHGILPSAKIECVEALINTVRGQIEI